MTKQAIVVTGTDTGVGKTVFSSALAAAADGYYWKPIQAGLDDETDSETVARLSGLPSDRILAEAWRLRLPASPHLAAARENIEIDPFKLAVPAIGAPLVIEGAGGLMVPITRDFLFIDLFARWRLPVVICARTALGTINHTLLSVEALRRRNIPILGIAFIGEDMPDTLAITAKLSGVRVLGRLPRLSRLSRQTLRPAFADHFDISEFTKVQA